MKFQSEYQLICLFHVIFLLGVNSSLEWPRCGFVFLAKGPRGLTNDGTVIMSLDAAEADAFNMTLP